MEICDCMYRQNMHGDSVCLHCNGDIYACECPPRHRISCPDNNDYVKVDKG